VAQLELFPLHPGPFREPELAELDKLDDGFHFFFPFPSTFVATGIHAARALLQRPAAEASFAFLHKLQLLFLPFFSLVCAKSVWDDTPAEGKIFVLLIQGGFEAQSG